MTKPPLPPSPPPRGNWVQTERAAHEAWAALMRASPRAAELMHHLVARVGEHNAVVISQDDLATLMGKSRRTVIRAAQDLADERWIEIRQIGKSGGVNAYVINDRVAWSGKRDGIRYSLFSANVVVSDRVQPDAAELGQQEGLRRLPMIGEGQIPSGPGLAPPSEPFLDGMEPDLPAANHSQNPDTWDFESTPTIDGQDADERYLAEWREFKQWRAMREKQHAQ